MERTLIARGQATILIQKDSYTIHQTVSEYIFTANNNGTIPQAVSFSSVIKVTLGDDNLTNFSIGAVTKPAGFSAITVNNTNKTVTFSVAANTTTMADSGLVTIPVIIGGQTFNVTFSYAKAKTGAAGVDSNMLDWVRDWNSAKTVIGSQSVITPKIFAGVKNNNNTITGVAIGKFPLSTINSSGTVTTETINGIYGFKDGYKTFAIDSTGSVLIGKGNQFIRYNPANGKIEFGSEVTLNWVNAINTAKTEAISSAATTAQAKADAAKNTAIATAATDASSKINAIKIGSRNYIRNSAFTSPLKRVSAEGTTVSIDTTILYDNHRTLKVIQNTACTDSNANSQRTYFNAINGKICTPASFSMYVKGSVAGTMRIRIGSNDIRTVNITTSWQRVVLENIIPVSAVVLFGFQTVGTYWCALPMLVEGSKAADWVPAPDDVDSDVSDAKKAGTDAKAVADAITNKANSEGWATKLTYIGSTGIFTGTLSANTVNAVRINASQITAGTIDAARINVAALKTSLITAGNIEALTLNVVRGKIGGWSIDADSIFRGTKNNTTGTYTATSGSVCIGSNGIRGFKWRLDSTGAGAVAGGNIAWDASGNVTFGSSVTLNWTNAANTAANNGKLYVRGTGYNHIASRLILLNGSKIHESSSRGLVLSVINRSDLKVVSHTHYDIYASDTNCNSLAAAMNALDSTKIVILSSFDAIRINASLSAAIQRCGGSDYTVTDARVPYVLIGIPGIGKNQGLTSIYGLETTAPFAEISTVIVNGIPQGINMDGKLKTYLSGSGIYTGTLNATQIIAGTIDTSRLNTTALKAALITAGNIEALTLNVTKGKIADFVVTGNKLYDTGQHVVLQSGASRRMGVCKAANSILAGGVACVMLYYNSDSDWGLYGHNGSAPVFQLGSTNQIAGWNINTTQIYKNSVYLGADGSITNGTKWKLNNDGSGQIANGNITWNSAGAVTFGASVSLQWKNDIESAKTANFGYRYAKTIVINGESNKYYPVIIKGGDQYVKRNLFVRRSYSEQAPDDWANSSTHKGGLILHIKTNFGGWGGASYSWDIYELSETYCRMFAGAQHCGNSCMFAIFLRGGGTTGAKYNIYSDQNLESDIYSPSPIPRSPQIAYNNDLIFKSPNGSNAFFLANAPAPRTLTTDVENEIRRRRFIVLAQGSDSTLAAHPLTYISGTGIYTGTLTANQINAVAINASSISTGTLSADRIAAGSISASKLNATSIKSEIINTAYINGLSCTFVRGTIGGWTITDSTISGGQIVLDKTNKRVVVYGESSSPTSGQRVQLYHNNNSDFGLCATNTTGSVVLRLGSINNIAGWTINTSQIFKNNIYLGADGSIYNGTKWKLNNDGSGRLANGNIAWDATGSVTFGSNVSLNWTNAATNALNSAKSYADAKKVEAINTAASDATNKANAAKELALATAFGKMMYRDPEFRNGNNGINIYNNSGGGTVTITRMGLSSAPNDSKMVLEIKTTGTASPGCGGFYFGTTCSNRKVFITKLIAKIPVGRKIQWGTNSIGTSGSSKWLTSNVGTGDWAEYVYKVTCGTTNFSTTNYFSLDGTQGTAAAPVVWHVAYATVFDTTSSEKYTTTIDANGIYTGTIRAGQVLIDSTLVVGGSSYNGSISVRNAGNAVMATLDRTGITAVAGKIGGWTIKSGSIYASSPAGGHRVYITSSGYLYNDDGSQDYWGLKADGAAVFGYGKVFFDRDGAGFLAGGNIAWDTKGNITANGGVFNDVTINGTIRNAFKLNDSSIWIGGNTDKQINFNKCDHIVAVQDNSGWSQPDIVIPWTIEHSGRRVCLVNYKWGSNLTYGSMRMTAPTGKYFFEDGIAKPYITFSRELVELLGYGDDKTFFGWIVINRLDLMTTKKYGANGKVLYSGLVNNGSMTRYKSFDGSTITCSRTGIGMYRVSLPTSFASTNDYTVMLTGSYYNGVSVYACLYSKYSSYFYVRTSDDETANDGAFTFQVISMGDWS